MAYNASLRPSHVARLLIKAPFGSMLEKHNVLWCCSNCKTMINDGLHKVYTIGFDSHPVQSLKKNCVTVYDSLSLHGLTV